MVFVTGLFAPARQTLAAAVPKHPAVVRVVVNEGGGHLSLGSGALVAVNEKYGLVLTNHHVVRDGNGTATVIFPDGFQSGATVVRSDRDWDLAALMIWRPRAQPITLAGRRPSIGEPLWIAGYGRGEYRMAAGRCTQYLSPGGRLPFDMIELSAGARQGDSGGPILNQHGQLAGVLFGAAWGKTSGSHALRVQQFLDPVLNQFDAAPADTETMIARHDRPVGNQNAQSNQFARRAPTATIPTGRNRSSNWSSGGSSPYDPNRPTNHGQSSSVALTGPANQTPWVSPGVADSTFLSSRDPAVSQPCPDTQLPLSTDPWEQGKTVLALVGLLAVGFHTLRWLGA